jgi:hypothetical protein
VSCVQRGRYRYYSLSGPQVGELIEAVARVAPAQPVTSLRAGSRAYALRYARRCYDHLAGRVGVAVTDALRGNGLLADDGTDDAPRRLRVSAMGAQWFADLGVSASPGDTARGCLDWTEQRVHVAGPIGRGMLDRFMELDWLVRHPTNRALRITDLGRRHLPERIGVALPDRPGQIS